jgi:hypothetical protein
VRERWVREPLWCLQTVLRTAQHQTRQEEEREQTAQQGSRARSKKKVTYWQCHCSPW